MNRNTFDIEEFYWYIGEMREVYTEWRPGQAWFNCLVDIRPDLAERIQGTGLDPFHDDKRIRTLDAWLKMNWSA